MSLVIDAYTDLYGMEPDYELSIKYTDQFKPYNANCRMRQDNITFKLSKKWKTVSREIQIGLIQELMLKILKKKKSPIRKQTTNMDLYKFYMQKIHIAIPKTKTDEILEASFQRINEQYFYNNIEQPNLTWGNRTLRKIGCYEFNTDTITMSTILKDEPELLDYVMHHEILHKEQKFESKNGRNHYHTKAFRRKEEAYTNSELLERALGRLVRKEKLMFWK